MAYETSLAGCKMSSLPRSMQYGMKGSDVECLQRLLIAATHGHSMPKGSRRMPVGRGAYPGNTLFIDGGFGWATNNQVEAFQSLWLSWYRPRNSGYVDGVAGPKTISWLKSFLWPGQFTAIWP